MPEQVLINSLLLLVSSLFCGLLFVFSLSQVNKTRHHLPLVIFLGFLSVWYLLLTINQVPSLEIIPKILRKVPVFGLARPILIFVFIGTAHCYIAAIRQREKNINRWLRPTKLYFYGFILISKVRLSLSDRFNSPTIAAIAALAGLIIALLTIFICYHKLNKLAPLTGQTPSKLGKLSWPISFSISITLILLAFYHTLQGNTLPSIYDSYALISLLPLIFWLIYYHTPYLFFDILVKRGIQALFFATIFGLYYGSTAYFLNAFGDHSLLFYLALSVIFSLPIGLLTRLQGILDRFVDVYLLGRVPFQDLLIELNNQLSASSNYQKAISLVCESIKKALRAKNVSYKAEQIDLPKPAINYIPIINQQEYLGYLHIEPIVGNQRYLSEDLKFVQIAATNLATTLSRLQLQLEQQESKVKELELINIANNLRLKALQAQLDPHFLFNSMSLIGSLVRSQPDKARSAVQYLSEVYRYVLDSSRRDFVSVADEINFLRAYLDIEQLRFESRVKVTFQLCNDLEKLFIPPMLLQPLVENAIKHGLSPKIEGGNLLIKALKLDQELEFTIADTGVGFTKNNKENNGVGLSNVRQQLLMRYSRTLEIFSDSKKGTTIKFSLPISQIDKLKEG